MFGSFLETCLFINKVEIVKETKEMQNSPQKKKEKKKCSKEILNHQESQITM
jgi:type III secretory pathway component EscU